MSRAIAGAVLLNFAISAQLLWRIPADLAAAAVITDVIFMLCL